MKIKPEFPRLYAHASKYIATPLILFTTVFLSISAFSLPAQDVYPMVFSAFGISAALSGISFTLTNDSTFNYVGEKFLHSSLLLMQSIAIIYVKSEAVKLSFVSSNEMVMAITNATFSVLFMFVSAAAAWSFYFGFDDLNDDLWKKYKKRINNIRDEMDK